MSIATREEILAYLVTLLGTVPGITQVYRNRGGFTEDQFPTLTLLDGSEDLASDISRLNLVKMPPAIFTLKPEIMLVAKPRGDRSNTILPDGTPAPIGPELSDWRDKILAAVINDATLEQMLTDTGNIRFLGCATDMAWDGSLSGVLLMRFSFNYVWVPPSA